MEQALTRIFFWNFWIFFTLTIPLRVYCISCHCQRHWRSPSNVIIGQMTITKLMKINLLDYQMQAKSVFIMTDYTCEQMGQCFCRKRYSIACIQESYLHSSAFGRGVECGAMLSKNAVCHHTHEELWQTFLVKKIGVDDLIARLISNLKNIFLSVPIETLTMQDIRWIFLLFGPGLFRKHIRPDLGLTVYLEKRWLP